jgi:hypothetical protein
LLLLVAKHIGKREAQSELAELHLNLQFPNAGDTLARLVAGSVFLCILFASLKTSQL